MKDLILVLTNSQDGKHSSSVISKILEAGRNVFRFDVDKIGKGELKIIFKADSNGMKLDATCFNQTITLDDIGSIWYRRPNYFDFQIKDPIQRGYAESELKSFLDNLWEFTDAAFWLNNPKSLERARKKIYQLKIAREIGFKIPDTIVTNNPTEAKKFFL